MGFEIAMAKLSGFFKTSVFGVISPKISKIKVKIPVVSAVSRAKFEMPIDLNNSRSTAVAITEAPILAILFPINMAVIKRLGSFNTLSNTDVFLDCCLSKLRNFKRPIAVNAVSALEKKPERNKRHIKTSVLKSRSESKFY